MKTEDLEKYQQLGNGATAFYEQPRGLIEVKGREGVQFLNGLVTNDVGKIEDGAVMLAAFPNAQGRLLGVVRVLRRGDAFLFETEAATHQKIYQNLFRFTYAGDFFVEDWSEKYRFLTITNLKAEIDADAALEFPGLIGRDFFVPLEAAEAFKNELSARQAVEIGGELYEILRVESGVPLYGVDMDETTIVPELGLDDLISYNKGCYIGQEIIARIHFRGHVAKQLRGLILSEAGDGESAETELKTADGRNAGRVTSVVFSPALGKTIALAYVRYDYLAEGTALKLGERMATVVNLPFVGRMS
jgi:folate-binding protein YgfZ